MRYARAAAPLDAQLKRVVRAAKGACCCFASYQAKFFNFDRRPGWRGWENWLTVEVCRRLHARTVLAFYRLDGRYLDLFVREGDPEVGVEIKVNYVDDRENQIWAQKGTYGLPARILKDRDKLKGLPANITRLLLVSTCFESRATLDPYQKGIDASLGGDFQRWDAEWHDCSGHGDQGGNLLLALSRPGVK